MNSKTGNNVGLPVYILQRRYELKRFLHLPLYTCALDVIIM